MNCVTKSIEECEQDNKNLLEEIENLESLLYQNETSNIQELYREIMKLRIDISCLSNQYELLNSNNNELQFQESEHVPSVSYIADSNLPGRSFNPPYPVQFPPNSQYISPNFNRQNSDFYFKHATKFYRPQRQGSLNYLDQVLQHPNQMWMQPINVNQMDNLVPPIPPRPSSANHSPLLHTRQIPPPLPPPRSSRFTDTLPRPRSSNEILDENDNIKWKCTACTYDNDDSLQNCEICNQSRTSLPGNNVQLIPRFGSLHSLSDPKSSPFHKKRNKRK